MKNKVNKAPSENTVSQEAAAPKNNTAGKDMDKKSTEKKSSVLPGTAVAEEKAQSGKEKKGPREERTEGISEEKRMPLQNLVFRVSGPDRREDLKDLPHLDVLNLAITFAHYKGYVDPGNPQLYPSKLCAEDFSPVTVREMETAGLEPSDLFRESVGNMRQILPPKCERLLKVIGIDESNALKGRDNPEADMYVLTNSQLFYGAGVIFYPGLLSCIAGICGQSFYLIPSSVHEMILIPERSFQLSVSRMNSIIREINTEELSENEVLSDTLYYYDRKSDTICYA